MTEIIFRTHLKSVSSSVFITELYLHIYHQPTSRDFISVNYFKHLFLQSLFILAWKNKQNQHYVKRTAHAHMCMQPLENTGAHLPQHTRPHIAYINTYGTNCQIIIHVLWIVATICTLSQ